MRDGALEFTVTTAGATRPSSIDWPADVPGPKEVERRTAALGEAPGKSTSFHQFDFMLGEPSLVTSTVEGVEEVPLGGETRRLRRVVTRFDQAGMPDVTTWIDEQGFALKTSMSMAGLTIISELASKERVDAFLAEGSAASAEVFERSMIQANVRLPRPRSLESVLYRVAPKQAGGPLPPLEDERQEIVAREADSGAVLLRVAARVPPETPRQRRPLEDPAPELAEYLEPNPMLQSDDPLLLRLAAEGVGEEQDAWNAAVRLERLVFETITQKSLDVVFASASEVAKTRAGDCSEHAVLLAALCRAAGIPARVAMGLVYAGGIFGGHAWTEVWIDGAWYALDGTIGRGVVDPTHLRFGVTSLRAGGLSAGLLGVLAGLGNIDLEIREYSRDGVMRQVDASRPRCAIENGRFTDRVEGLSFAVPEGWSAADGAPGAGGMSNEFVLAELSRAGAGVIRVVARQVRPDFALDALPAELAGGGAPVFCVPRRMAGRTGAVATGGSEAQAWRAAALLLDDTLYVVRAAGGDDAALEAFEQVVDSLAIE
ncbi:MAG: transglutaminase domain-containing protein [Planctomycetes bacterium]|nr:transglutaminase domain-containing protein [Planctomycetota bacterium]